MRRSFYLALLAIWIHTSTTWMHSYSVEAFVSVTTGPIRWGRRPFAGYDCRARHPHSPFLTRSTATTALHQSTIAVDFSAASDSNNDTEASVLSPADVFSSKSTAPDQTVQQQQQLDNWVEALPVLLEQAGRALDRNQAVQAAATVENLWKQNGDDSSLLFNRVLQAWARVSQRLAELHYLNQQQQHQQQHLMTSNHDPTETVLNNRNVPVVTLVDVSQSSIYHAHDAAEHAEQLLRQALNGDNALSVDTGSLNAVLEAWAKSRDQQAGDRCITLLRTMRTASLAPLDTRSYLYVLEALSYSQAPDRMEQLHHWYDSMQRDHPVTTATTHTILVAYSRWSKQQSAPYNSMMYADSGTTTSEIAFAAVQRLRELQATFEKTRNTNQQPDAPTVTLGMSKSVLTRLDAELYLV